MFLRPGPLVQTREPVACIVGRRRRADPAPQQTNRPASNDFTERVRQYMKLRNALPNQRSPNAGTNCRTAGIHWLAQSARRAPRLNKAKSSRRRSSEQFLKVIRGTLSGGANAANVRTTIARENP